MASFVENVNKVAALIPAESVDLGVVADNIDNINLLKPVITDLQSIVNNVVPNIAEILLADDNAAIATTKAGKASTSASEALGYRNEALGFRNEAEAFNESKAFVVDTVEDLLTIPSSYVTAVVRDLNRGGTFVWSPTGTANGGTVFAGATGFWNRQYSGAVNVKWFGAVGGELSSLPDVDNTPYILSAINSLPTLGGKVIIDQHYKCKTTLEIHDKIGITLQGIGGNTSCSLRFTEDVVCISIKSTSANPETCFGHSIKDLWISGYKDNITPADGSYPVVKCDEAMLLTFDNVYIEDGGQQLYLNNVNSSNFSNIKLEGRNSLYITHYSLSNTFSNIIIINDGRGSNSTYGMMLDSLRSSSIKMSALNLRGGASDYGIYVKDSGQFAISNVVIRNFDQGVLLENSNYNTLEDIKVTNALGCVSFIGTSNNNKVLSLIAEDSINTVTFLSGTPTENFIEVANYKNITIKTLGSTKSDVQYKGSYSTATGTLSSTISGIISVPYLIPFTTLSSVIDAEGVFSLDSGYIKINASGFYQFNIQADFRLSSVDTFNTINLVESSNTLNPLATVEGSASTNTTVTPNLSIARYCKAGEKYSITVSSNDTSFDINLARTKFQVYKIFS